MENNNTETQDVPKNNDPKVKILIGVVIAGVALCVCVIIALLFLMSQKPQQISCNYEGKTYKSGEGFMASDGCNSCACGENGEVACTLKYCAPEQPVSNSITPEFDNGPGNISSEIPDDLITKSFAECNTTVGVPPQSGLYVESTDTIEFKWVTNKTTPVQNPDMNNAIFNKGVMVVAQWPHFINSGDIVGSDNPERSIGIYCGENNGYTIDTFIDALDTEYNETAMEVWGQEFDIENLGKETKWGLDAYKIRVDGPFESADEDYIVFKGNTVYRINKNYFTDGGFVNLTLDAIYNSIVIN
jgi:hypothetical protein